MILDQEPPVASAGSDVNIEVGNYTTFNGSRSTDNWGIVNFTWNFEYDGDEISLYGQVVSFQFNESGIYEVTLTVKDVADNTGTDKLWVSVTGEEEIDLEPPVANAGKNIDIVKGTTVTFNGTGSSDNVGIFNYTWSFTYDGDTIELYGARPSFRFNIVGNYSITLTVLDYTIPPNSDSDTVMVKVKDKSDLDSDGDGIDDQWEDDHGLDKYNASDAGLDFDNDGLTNLEEYEYGTNPNDPDSDDDGLPDGWEIEHGLDPLDDGSIDINNGPEGDPDGDGYTNLEELQNGTEPDDATSKPKEVEEEDDEDYMMYIIIMIVVIIVLISLLAFALRKPGPSGDELLAGEEEEEIPTDEENLDEEELPVSDEDTFECPTCGAELKDGDDECPECGEEFGDEE